MRRAFTIIELIITMVILSIVSYIASDLIAKTYIGYNQTNALNKANLKLEIALNSIANRLEYAIEDTIVKRKSATNTAISPIDLAPPDYTVLEWVGSDIDSFEAHKNGGVKPAISRFCNLKKSTRTKIVTNGSNLYFANEIIQRLSNNQARLNLSGSVALFFPGNYDYTNIGYNSTPNTGVAKVSSFGNDYFNLSSPVSRITEVYKLAWSAYAVLPINCNNNGCDLVLRYNFRPWQGDDYNSKIALKYQSLLTTNVTVFKTYATQNRVHIKLCVKEQYGINKGTSVCKEKVVYK
jgi:prepilin-type N-terminal cleavage/methylation domain-containing protein